MIFCLKTSKMYFEHPNLKKYICLEIVKNKCLFCINIIFSLLYVTFCIKYVTLPKLYNINVTFCNCNLDQPKTDRILKRNYLNQTVYDFILDSDNILSRNLQIVFQTSLICLETVHIFFS